MVRQFFLGFIRIHVLYHASHEPICGVDMMQELERHGYSVSPGLMYPTLHSLAKGGYLESERRTVAGKMRRYYHITPRGRELMEEARSKISELVNEVME